MELNRRQFLALTSAAAAMTALEGVARADQAGTGQVIDAGPAGKFAADGIYSDFHYQGFFLVRKGGQLTAVSSICTHRKVGLMARPDCTLYCHRHGSIFAADGHVLKGPANRDLPMLATRVDPATGHLLVTVPALS